MLNLFQFKLYDKDGSGSVELPEMIEILVMIYQVATRIDIYSFIMIINLDRTTSPVKMLF